MVDAGDLTKEEAADRLEAYLDPTYLSATQQERKSQRERSAELAKISGEAARYVRAGKQSEAEKLLQNKYLKGDISQKEYDLLKLGLTTVSTVQ